jgi:O-antigen/teichoic acid export membrane protein
VRDNAISRSLATQRILLGIGSQGLSSISNFALFVLVARSSTVEEFGAFAISYSIAVLCILAVRAGVGETLAVTITCTEDQQAALGAAVVVGGGLALGWALVAVALPVGVLRDWFLLFSLGLPLLTLQDAGRHIGFATQAPRVAMTSDAIWLSCQILAWSVLAAASRATAPALLIAWWASAALAAAALVTKTGLPAFRRGGVWLKFHSRLAGSFIAESLLTSGASQSAVYAVGALAGLPAAGALRASQTLYAPVRAAASGVESVALPEANARLRNLGRASLLRYQLRVVAWLLPFGVLAVTVLKLLPDSLGEQLLSETWFSTSLVLLPVGIGFLAGLALMGARLGLRSMRAGRVIVRLHLIGGLLVVALGVAGATLGGLVGAAWGLTLAQLTLALLAWACLMRLHWTEGLGTDTCAGSCD